MTTPTPSPDQTVARRLPQVVVVTTAMLTLISFWRAAAIVLNDLASSAYYAGGIAEQTIGKVAPWLILAVMLLSYAVRSVYIESCGMFVRAGVHGEMRLTSNFLRRMRDIQTQQSTRLKGEIEFEVFSSFSCQVLPAKKRNKQAPSLLLKRADIKGVVLRGGYAFTGTATPFGYYPGLNRYYTKSLGYLAAGLTACGSSDS